MAQPPEARALRTAYDQDGTTKVQWLGESRDDILNTEKSFLRRAGKAQAGCRNVLYRDSAFSRFGRQPHDQGWLHRDMDRSRDWPKRTTRTPAILPGNQSPVTSISWTVISSHGRPAGSRLSFWEWFFGEMARNGWQSSILQHMSGLIFSPHLQTNGNI